MSYSYINSFFSSDEVDQLFSDSPALLERAHEERGGYKKVTRYLSTELGMKEPLCIQTFAIGEDYSPSVPHIDIATAFFPSITNVWFCSDDCIGEPFGFLKYATRPDLYQPWQAALQRGELADYQQLCAPEHVKDYYRVCNYKKGDVLFFDSRQAHSKLSATPRSTLVLKYISSTDLVEITPVIYARIPVSSQWLRVLVFDHLRAVSGTESRKKFLRDTQALISHWERQSRLEVAPEKIKRSIGQRLRQMF